MYIFTENGSIVNMDRVDTICVDGNTVVAGISGWECDCVLKKCKNKNEAQLLVQEIFEHIERGRRVFYIGEFVLPF